MIRVLPLLALLLLLGCESEEPYPRPRGYHRLELPPHTYTRVDSTWMPYTLELPTYGVIAAQNRSLSHFDVKFKDMDCNWHVTTRWFKREKADPFHAYEDYRQVVYKHAQRGQIKEIPIQTNEGMGTVFVLSGPVPTPHYVFFSDTTNYAVECSFYYNTSEKNDSLAPITHHLERDLEHMVRSIRFRKP